MDEMLWQSSVDLSFIQCIAKFFEKKTAQFNLNSLETKVEKNEKKRGGEFNMKLFE